MQRLLLSLSLAAAAVVSVAQGWTGDATTVIAGGSYSFKQGLIRTGVRSNLAAPTDVYITPNPFAPVTPSMVPGSVFTIGKMDIPNPFNNFDVYYRESSLPAGAIEANLQIYRWNGSKWIVRGGSAYTIENHVRIISIEAGTYCLMANNQVIANSNDLLVYTAHKQTVNAGALHAITNQGGWYKVELGTPGTSRVSEVIAPFEHPYLCSLDQTYTRAYFWRKQPSGFYEIYAANIDMSNPVRLTNFGNVTDFGFISASLTGNKLAFCAKVNGGWNAYAMDTEGNNQLLLATNIVPALLNAPTPAHQGARIAVCGTNTLYLYDGTTGALATSVTPPGNPYLGGVSFASNGLSFVLSTTFGLYTGTTATATLTLRHTASYPSDIAPVYNPASSNYIAAPYQDGIDTLQISPKIWTENVFYYGTSSQPRMVMHWR